MLNKAINIASIRHSGQIDKAGKPYILHPLRVMLSMETEEEMICAVLHDVVEDTGATAEYLLNEGFSVEIIDAVFSVSKDKGKDKDYFDLIRRAKNNPIGRRVKIADLQDNMNLSRIENPNEKDYERIEKYKKALSILRSDEE